MKKSKILLTGLTSVVFLSLASPIFADTTNNLDSTFNVPVSKDVISTVKQNDLIQAMGTTKNYAWGELSTDIYLSGTMKITTSPDKAHEGMRGSVYVTIYKRGEPQAVHSFTLMDGGLVNNNITLKGYYGYHYIDVVSMETPMWKGTYNVTY
ncbi:hypothetical protein HW560_10935 [Paenibacillus sp. E222]|uniref:hypothetical protein n=1 Tax=Paenibacillus sp. E222 TaxID=2748863 RepID=UPI0015C5CBF3|nr:hypothetical protein [Paenibacillus sp. E222]QLG38566.1 hypothetical protein HW560_10935 [Paenibacillus sp. E222]